MNATFSRHHEAESYGPFGFLNPTIRKLPFEPKAPEIPREEDALQGKGDGGKRPTKGGDAELRAEAVQREFRSRDNRKGMRSLSNRNTVADLSCDFQVDMPLPWLQKP